MDDWDRVADIAEAVNGGRSKAVDQVNKSLELLEKYQEYQAVISVLKENALERAKNPLDMYLADVMTVAANLTGIPAANIPIGFDDNNLPIGLQVMAKQRSDRDLLSLCQSLESIFK